MTPARPQTIAEKIFSAHANRPAYAGESVVARVDVVMATDGSGPLALDFFRRMGGTRSFDGTKVLMVLDHYVPCPNDKVAALQDQMRDFARAGNAVLFELGEGICHQILPERGYVRPGSLLVGGDSHSTTYGAFNALGIGVGSSDLAAAILTGALWFRVPASLRVTLRGALPSRVTAKDLSLETLRRIGAGGAIYQSVEFGGTGLHGLGLPDRMTLCNVLAETGAKCAVVPGDQATRDHFRGELSGSEVVVADEGAAYVGEVAVSLDALEPLIAQPHEVDRVTSVRDLLDVPIHMGVLGTCTNGRVEDLELALAVMGKARVAPGVELLVVPASRAVYLEAARRGMLARFVEKGGTVLPPGCGPCCGSSAGIPSDGENVLSTANRNFLGRMGNTRARIYLGSPATVAAAVVAGRITDPRET
ncbi:MAG TPA: aconitase/3-isopropylmalate dehydratase large subunit family protein [Candidatus Methylomirabilis sp.]|nr:aconitase/3-isopropylmalate dehydratase large subunit family protein [Candidatus Methylomirabilis sp.]